MERVKKNTDVIWIKKILFKRSGEIQANGKCHFNKKWTTPVRKNDLKKFT